MKRIISFLAATAALLVSFSCGKEPVNETPTADVSFEIEVPKTLKTYPGAEVTFKFTEGKGPVMTDKLFFKVGSKTIECQIKYVRKTDFTFIVSDELTTASYFVWIDRGGVQKKVGTVSLQIVDESEIPDVDYNLFGKVSSGGKPLEGVVVSDGHLVTTTNAGGMYYLQSEKKRGYVFISIPSGYEAASSGVLPKFHKKIKRDQYEIEQADFILTKVDGQDSHVMYVLGDLHLADRNDDLKQFRVFADDLNRQIAANSGKRQYAITLGDMTWEIYWNQYNLSSYLTDLNKEFSGAQFFHTIGNHDHSVTAAGDFDTVLEYFDYVGPNYYSFNIGSVHYVVLDNINCKNTGAGDSDSRKYSDEVGDEQLAWLEKDLQHVDPSMTVVVTSHAPVYSPSNATAFKAALNDADKLLASLSKFKNVHFFTGHTHDIYNVDKTGSSNHFEHNAGAVCATWWWTYKTCQMNLARDGAPGGYTVCEFNGGDFEWLFKAYDRDEDYQFRAYDMNKVKAASSTFPNGYDVYSTAAENSILINIWNWDPEWKLSVKENGNELKWEQIFNFDPLHILGYTKVRPNSNSSFLTKKTPHLFLVQASAADTTLEIEVTDRFGNIYKESMKRPYTFNVANYQ